MFKTILLILLGIIIIAVAGFFVFINSVPPLPPEADTIIEGVMQSELQPFVSGETGIAKNGKVRIWYESFNPPDSAKGAVLLIMGHGATALLWPDYFYQPIVDSGYQVIRYDNRGLGMSDWMEDWDESNPYSLKDMAKDGVAILDALDIEKAHIIGVSMGGMIGQRLAISHSDRILSLTSIMSSGDITDPDLPAVPKEFELNFLKLALKYGISPSETDIIKFSLTVQQMVMGDGGYPLDIEYITARTLYEIRHRRGYNTTTGDQHTAAVLASGSSYSELPRINLPALVIHGKSDPLVNIAHSKKLAAKIYGATTLWIDGMGHDLPRAYVPQMLESIFRIFQKAG